MKRFFKYIAVALAMSLLAIGCTPEIIAPDQDKLPSTDDFDVTISVDQATNYVTFTMNNTGMVPMWIFGDVKIDKDVNKKYAYTTNGISLRFRDAGEHFVEVKAYNANGISMGSKIYSFSIENTYRDPFDPSSYVKAITGEWMWNNEVAGHFGCGPDLAGPAGWWAAGANEKADWSLYNDRMTFTADGKYQFNPGDDGKVYVNAGFSALGASPDGADFLVDIPAYETTYSFENNWNEAGIEEIWLVLPAQKNLSYIPNQTIYDDPRFLVMDSKPSSMRKELKLAAALAPNGDGTISWYYNFIPAVHVASPEELLAGTSAEGKVWVMDSASKGHLGCGESAANAAGWWSAGPEEKAGTGLYDDEITFYPGGKYVYSSGADGLMYINWGVTAIGPNPGVEPDIDIEWPLTESTYEFDGETITLAANTPMVYVPSDYVWENPVFHVTALTETSMTVVAENPGCYWQMIFKARDIKGPAGPTLNDVELPAEISVSQGEVLALGNINVDDIWVDPDFFEANGNMLTFKAVDGDYKFTYDAGAKWIKVVPMYNGEKATYENGKALWIIGDGGGKPTTDQLIGWNTGDAPLPCAQISENTYQITLAMKAEGGSVKVFGQADWGREWTKDKYGTVTDNGFFHIPGDDGNIHTITGTQAGYYTFTFVDNGGILDMTVDKVRQTVWDPADATWNKWLNKNLLSMSYYYAPGWSQIADPGFADNGDNYVITLPEATADQWQAQVAFHTDMTSSAAKTYDFQVVLNSTLDHPGVTIKLVLSGGGDNDNIYYFADRHPLTAYEDYVYRMENMPGIDMDKISLFFDFGGNAAGTEVTVSNVLFQEHRAE
ncbi:MAG: DUF5121 domain-containing protein [Bacteroidales bacterium]|nr:DUF5121 domain-containing protein [Bacteroidales bacterium]